MTKRMLIDASQPEEIRVAVVSGNRLDEFDYESAARKQLKGNIYLAKVTRVEPSLQAAFVEYGGNRHGFLPFSEIHPDYYRIPIADRQALLAEEANHKNEIADDDPPDSASVESAPSDSAPSDSGETENGDQAEAEADSTGEEANGDVEEVAAETSVDTIEGDDDGDAARRRARFMRRYKIQEVIKRRQVLLIQVTKEERGNKGAALTSYLSLAGRYCVLMPNTARGGGISRKINSAADRRRLKSVVAELDIPEGVAVIVRTAGSQRSKPEIRRDYDYLLRLWSEIRDTTLSSTAPALIYEEANLIKRAIRDLYRSDMEEILVEGEADHKAAKAFMKSLMPSHAKNVKLYKDAAVPLFQRHQVEGQIDAMHSPTVQLKSGGYIVMNVTEALIAVDVNSGKATRERHIEETAYKTNLEASDEVARQLRLRDLAGLIVIDYIDMEESRHNRSVERRLKDALRTDRARIQLGRISPFGLLEMSRQRLRPSLVETTTGICPTCQGTGHVRTTESAALHVMRALEEDAVRRGGGDISIAVPPGVAGHLLNNMRARLVELEQIHGLIIRIDTDEDLIAPNHRLERSSQSAGEREDTASPRRAREKDETSDSDGERKRGRSRGGRRRRSEGRGEDRGAAPRESVAPVADQDEDEADSAAATSAATSTAPETQTEGTEEPAKRRRRRGKRGGRRRGRRDRDESATTEGAEASTEATGTEASSIEVATETPSTDTVAESTAEEAPAAEDTAKKKTRSRRSSGGQRRRTAKTADTPTPETVESVADADTAPPAEEKKPAVRKPRSRARKPATAAAKNETASPLAAMPQASEPVKNSDSQAPDTPAPSDGDTNTTEQTQRRGWWQRWG